MFHRRRVEINAEGIWCEVVEVVRLKAGDICRNFEAGSREFRVERVVARMAGPLEDALSALTNQLIGISGGKPALTLTLLNEVFRTGRKDLTSREQLFYPLLCRWIKVVRHQQRREHTVLGSNLRAKCGGDDRLALRAHTRHVVEIVRLHGEAREETANPTIFVRATDADRTMALA